MIVRSSMIRRRFFQGSPVDGSTLSGHNGGMKVTKIARVFKENVIRLLDEKKMSRSELSRLSGIDQPSLTTLLNHDREIRSDTMEKICTALECEIIELLVEPSHV